MKWLDSFPLSVWWRCHCHGTFLAAGNILIPIPASTIHLSFDTKRSQLKQVSKIKRSHMLHDSRPAPWWCQKHRYVSLLLHFFVAIKEVQQFSNDASRLHQKKRLLSIMSVYAKVKESFAMKFDLARALPCFSLARNGFMWRPLRPSLQKGTGYHKWLLIMVYPHTGKQRKKKEFEC